VFVFLSKFFRFHLSIADWLRFCWRCLYGNRRLQRIVLILALLCLLLAGNSWVAIGLARSLEWRYLPPDPVPQAEVIVVLGGGTAAQVPPRPMVEVNGSGDRVIYAAGYAAKAQHILVSGGLLV
jgi:uncharacterized SAM-binding protein YcdF (DUF218 family)